MSFCPLDGGQVTPTFARGDSVVRPTRYVPTPRAGRDASSTNYRGVKSILNL